MITCQFGSKKFEVKSKKIYTPDEFKISESLNTEEVEVKGKKPTLKVNGIGLQSISLTLKLDCRFVTVDNELRWWKNTMLAKKSYMLTYGNFQIGQMFLTGYDVEKINVAKTGVYTSATLNLTFTEDGAYANKKKISFTAVKKVSDVKDSNTSKKPSSSKSPSVVKKIRKGSTIKPKSGVRWYYTAEGALKKTGISGKAYNKEMKVSYTYSKNGKIVCVCPPGGWMKVEDVNVIKY